ncbi:diacylglycerol/lipid kinase family protein [Cumulibacter soli]|uniref:diacylglycerol/lipid kinase family protein n=1 Tax=Cumulibacter soli TaxID=2546344 RepID=UPI00141A4229|nr:diacylglycerol kinase family protein [Cumulibacter soli]
MSPLPATRLPFGRRRSTRFPIAGRLIGSAKGSHQIGVVLHPQKRDSTLARELLDQGAAKAGWPRPLFYETSIAEPGTGQTRRALADGCDLIIACGGDGTVRVVADALRHTRIPLGIIPIGTANIFARNLVLPTRDLNVAVMIAMHGEAAAVDIGVARTTTSAQQRDHVFLVLAGIGHDATTVQGTRPALKERAGWLAYLESASRHAWLRPIEMTLQYPANPPRTVQAWSVVIGNCGKVPGGIAVFPGAVIDDGVLDVLEVTVTHPVQWVPIGVKGLLHLRARTPGLRHAFAPQVTIEPSEPQPVQVDGDVITGVRRLDVGVDHRAVVVRVPKPRA